MGVVRWVIGSGWEEVGVATGNVGGRGSEVGVATGNVGMWVWSPWKGIMGVDKMLVVFNFTVFCSRY